MIDIKFLRDNLDHIEKSLARRGYSLQKDKFIALDLERKSLQVEVESLQSDRKALSNDFGKLKSSGENTDNLKKKIDLINDNLKIKNESLNLILESINSILLDIPNIPHESTPDGKNENDNVVIRTVGKITSTNTVDHIDITKKIDTDLAAKLAGSRFAVLKGSLAKLQRALISLMLDTAIKNGYEEYYLPYMANKDSLIGTGNLPKFEEDLFKTSESLYLIPTAEVPITNIYRDVILKEVDFPVKNCGYTPCFRREAGSYGSDVRGLNRLHQFDKVEIVQLSHPDKSYELLDEMVDYIKTLLTKLELPYRILRLCGGDLGFTAALTYDFEVYSAAQKKWLEVSSVSCFETYQANRLKLRFKDRNGKMQLAHTLNGSALAFPRIIAALLENNQSEKGVKLPKALIEYTGFEYID